MNKQFLKLATQADITIGRMVVDGIEYDYQHVVINDAHSKDEAAVLEKFAELIVRECIAKVSEWDMGIDHPAGATDNTSQVARDIVAEIKEHFGVK